MMVIKTDKRARAIFLKITLTLSCFVISGCPETSTKNTASTPGNDGIIIRPGPEKDSARSISDCSKDGQIGCKTTNLFRSVDMNVLKPEVIKDGLTAGGVLGRLMTPADYKQQSASARIAMLGFLSLDNYATLSAAHSWRDINTAKTQERAFHSYLAIAILGANSSSQVVFKLQQARDILGTGVKDVPGKSYTHRDVATGQRLYMINLKYNELDTLNGYSHVRLRVEVVGGTTTSMTGLLLGIDPMVGSAEAINLAEVMAVIQ